MSAHPGFQFLAPPAAAKPRDTAAVRQKARAAARMRRAMKKLAEELERQIDADIARERRIPKTKTTGAAP